MEFSRRGPATDDAGDGHRFPDPPPHGEPMLVMRDALLSQLQKDRLRQEIIVAELAKIERAMALRAATGGHQAECLVSIPCEGKAARQNTASDEQRLPDSNQAVPETKASVAEKWELTGTTIPVKKPKPPMKWNCTVCQVQATSEKNLQMHYAGQKHLSNVATLDPKTKASGQKAKQAAEPSLGTEQKKTSSINWSCSTCQASGTSKSTFDAHLQGKRHQQNIAEASVKGDGNGAPMPLHGAAAADAGRSKLWPLSADQLKSQQNAEFDEHKLPDSNKAVPQSKTSLAEKWELTGITIPVKKPKPPIRWNCTVCQVQATSEQNLQQHYAGQKHLSNVATLGLGTKPSDQKEKAAAAEPSLGTEQKKTSSINWSCSTCQARGTSKSTLDAHLQGKRHQQNIAEASVKGNGNGAPKNAAAGEAKSAPAVWSCSICQTTCTCETDLKNHLRGTRHREKVQSLLEEGKNMARNPETNLKKNNAPQMVKNQESHSAWNCTMCEAKCYSKSQFENHCGGSRHQQKIEAILGKRETAKASSSRTANEPPSDGSSGKNASSEKAEKKATLYFCEVCNLLGSSSEMLVHHRYGKRHREKLSAGK